MKPTLSLYEAFGKVSDPRDPSGKRHPLQAILTLTTGRDAFGLPQSLRNRSVWARPRA